MNLEEYRRIERESSAPWVTIDTSLFKEGRKDDHEKTQLALVDPEFVEGVGQVLTFGSRKYAAYNWAKGISYHRVFSACLRHLYAWWKGERNDPETGLSHLYHAACNLMFLAHYNSREVKYRDFDDRPTKE